MKTQQEIEKAQAIMRLSENSDYLDMGEILATKTLIDFCNWVLDKPNKFGGHIYEPLAGTLPVTPENDSDTIAE